ncbi:MAG TPA: glycosyl hydrolase family 28 protein [Roseimicrobium sp.]|nr:glycosyl hydrolase family 28 protein [Roseimicrobium sp.]
MSSYPKLAVALFALAVINLLFTPSVIAAAGTVIDATKAGAIGDGTTLNTASIQKAIDNCAAGGGGTVHFPAGRYLTGTIQIKSNITLRLAKDATLLGSTDIADYLNLDPFLDGPGDPMGHALVVAVDAKNVGIEGEGTIDGQGRELRAKQDPYKKRPFLVRWVRCTRVKVKDVHLTHPGAWTLNFFQSKEILVEGVTIRTQNSGVNNADGIDLDSCQDAVITRCDIQTGDDAFCLKSTSLVPTRNIKATNLTLSTWCNAIKLGTESIGGFENISVSNCRVTNTGMAGIALYTVDGGDLRKVTISDITMDGVGTPVSIRRGARLKTFRNGDQHKTTPGKLVGVTIKNVTATNSTSIGILINGVPGYPVENLLLENIQIEVPGGGTAEDAKIQLPENEGGYPENRMFGPTLPSYGIYARHVRGAVFKNIKIKAQKPDARPEKAFIDAETAAPAR